MSTNPFDVEDGTFRVLVNAEDQYSLWPADLAVPRGWTEAHGPAAKDGCLEYVRTHWTDPRPRSLAAADPRRGAR
jgi:MbtH protein